MNQNNAIPCILIKNRYAKPAHLDPQIRIVNLPNNTVFQTSQILDLKGLKMEISFSTNQGEKILLKEIKIDDPRITLNLINSESGKKVPCEVDKTLFYSQDLLTMTTLQIQYNLGSEVALGSFPIKFILGGKMIIENNLNTPYEGEQILEKKDFIIKLELDSNETILLNSDSWWFTDENWENRKDNFILKKEESPQSVYFIGKYQSKIDKNELIFKEKIEIPVLLKGIALPKNNLSTFYNGKIQNLYSNYLLAYRGRIKATNIEQISSGVYESIFSIINPTEDHWVGTESSEDITRSWEIKKAVIPTPPEISNPLVYNEKEQNPFTSTSWWEKYNQKVEINNASYIDAGKYKTDFTLLSSNYIWENNGQSKIFINWEIVKKELKAPYITNTNFSYLKGKKIYIKDVFKEYLTNYSKYVNYSTVENSTQLEISSEYIEKVGLYTTTFYLKDPKNYRWDKEFYSFTWQISSGTISLPPKDFYNISFQGKEIDPIQEFPSLKNYLENYKGLVQLKDFDNRRKINAGTYILSFQIIDSNYKWANNQNASVPQQSSWKIVPAKLSPSIVFLDQESNTDLLLGVLHNKKIPLIQKKIKPQGDNHIIRYSISVPKNQQEFWHYDEQNPPIRIVTEKDSSSSNILIKILYNDKCSYSGKYEIRLWWESENNYEKNSFFYMNIYVLNWREKKMDAKYNESNLNIDWDTIALLCTLSKRKEFFNINLTDYFNIGDTIGVKIDKTVRGQWLGNPPIKIPETHLVEIIGINEDLDNSITFWGIKALRSLEAPDGGGTWGFSHITISNSGGTWEEADTTSSITNTPTSLWHESELRLYHCRDYYNHIMNRKYLKNISKGTPTGQGTAPRVYCNDPVWVLSELELKEYCFINNASRQRNSERQYSYYWTRTPNFKLRYSVRVVNSEGDFENALVEDFCDDKNKEAQYRKYIGLIPAFVVGSVE